jgi:dethiobiotin synthetase
MASNFFHIIGTDTDVGKTYVTHQLLHLLNQERAALPVKPIHSGWPKNEELGEDLACHSRFYKDINPQKLCCYKFEEPCSPNYAAKLENKHIKMDVLDTFMKGLDEFNTNLLLIEGIGGLCCPLSDNLTYIDFVKKHKAPAFVVGRVGLGGLNHMIMTCKLLESINIEIRAVILNCEKEFSQNDPIFESVQWELSQQLNTQIIGPLLRGQDEKNREILSKINF